MFPVTDTRPKKILIVDDEELLLQTIKSLLERRGFEIATAVSGLIAQESLSRDTFDALIFDIHLPGGLSGLDLCRHVKRTSAVPVILMTGDATLAELQSAKEVGADGLLVKPFTVIELEKTLERFFHAREELSGP